MQTISLHKKLNPLYETKSLIMEILNDYKTPASKKAFMTREMKAHVDFLKDVAEAVTREHSRGWYLGEFYTARHVLHYSKELIMLQEIKDSIG